MLSKEEISQLNIDNLKKVHFIGITSGFNSFCANYLLEKGIKVTASEINQDSDDAKDWIKRGVLYPGAHNAKYITEDLDLVVYPNGPIPGNSECERTETLGLPALNIAQLTGIISKNYKVIAVAGTHGKTTTSALITWMLYKHFKKLPNFIIGDKILEINKSWNYNPDSNYLVLEACEYKRQFLDRAPTPFISVLTNVELDHTDYYHSQEDYNSAFSEFISHTTGFVIIDKSQVNILNVLEKSKLNAKVIDVNDIKDKYIRVKTNLHGKHNIENSLRAFGVAKALDITPELEDFPGVASRFEYKGKTINQMSVYLDYAHNPKKIRACLQETNEVYPNRKIIFVWQPHSYERTYSFREDFARSLDNADIILIPNIYAPTREKDQFKDLITPESFVGLLSSKNLDKEIIYTKTFENTASVLNNSKYDNRYVCVLASAGDLYKILPLLNLKK